MDRNIGEELIQSARNGQIGNLIEILDKNAGIVNYADDRVALILSQYLIILCINSFFYFYIYFIRMVSQLLFGQLKMATNLW
jgi:hypothetical protein